MTICRRRFRSSTSSRKRRSSSHVRDQSPDRTVFEVRSAGGGDGQTLHLLRHRAVPDGAGDSGTGGGRSGGGGGREEAEAAGGPVSRRGRHAQGGEGGRRPEGRRGSGRHPDFGVDAGGAADLGLQASADHLQALSAASIPSSSATSPSPK